MKHLNTLHVYTYSHIQVSFEPCLTFQSLHPFDELISPLTTSRGRLKILLHRTKNNTGLTASKAMLPSTRRLNAALTPFTLFIALLLLFTSTANAASSVLGIDFGTLNLKAALVKPGIPLEIVLTKDSKRKEAAVVGFKPTRDEKNNIVAEDGKFPERLYGGDALALQGRMPGEVFPNLKPLLGLPWSEAANRDVEAYKQRYPALQAQHVEEMGTTVFRSEAFTDQELPWSVEELLAMEFANIKHNAEGLAKSSVGDAVITVPAFYTADERRAIERAAELAGLHVMSLISDGLAVGLDYAKPRTFPMVTSGEQPEYHIVYDMGAGSTTATLLRFQGKSVKDVGRYNKTIQEVAVVGEGWDRTLGGDALNSILVDHYLQKFLEKSEVKSRDTTAEELRNNGRLMSRLVKEAEKARQVLSANSDTYSSFEELLPDVDFKVKLTRTEFEELTESLAKRVTVPLQDALASAKLTLDDVNSIVLHGGAIRTPFVQKRLESLVGDNAKLRTNVNADESAVFGAAFKGAGLSPSFRVKEIRDSDIAGYAMGMTFADGTKDRRQVLFSPNSPVGSGASTKQVSFKDKDDFSFGLFQVIGEVDRPISRVQTTNLTDSVNELKEKFGCEKDDVSTKFSIKLSSVDGLPEVLFGSVSCEVEGSGKAGGMMDSAKDWLGFGKKKDQEALGEDGEEAGPTEEVEASTSSATESASSTSDSASASTTAVEKPKQHTESVMVAFYTTPMGNPQPGPDQMQSMKERLAAFDRSDAARFAREEALNVLEAYTYSTRDFLTNTDYASVATDAQREAINTLLTSTREWMEEPAEMAKASEATFREKLQNLKDLVVPIQTRRKEELARPEKVSALRESLKQTDNLITMIRDQVEKASSLSSEAAASTSSSSTSSSSTATDSDDLEDSETSSTSSSSATPQPSAFTPYTNADLEEVLATHGSVSQWLEDKEAEQQKLASSEEPALLVRDIEAKANQLALVMKRLIEKKTQKPPKPSSSSSKSSSSKKSSKTKKPAKSSATESADGGGKEGRPKILNLEDFKGEGDGKGGYDEEAIMRMVEEAKARAGKGESAEAGAEDGGSTVEEEERRVRDEL